MRIVGGEDARGIYGSSAAVFVHLAEGETEVTYPCGQGTSIEIFEAPTSGSERTLAKWSVADLDAEVATLTDAGVALEHYDEVFGIRMGDDNILRTPRGNAAWLRDPDGNLLLLTQPAA